MILEKKAVRHQVGYYSDYWMGKRELAVAKAMTASYIRNYAKKIINDYKNGKEV